ncbi:Ankyrin repeat-containing protein [Spatholobus suberectus]|nr:Ankyrin repeat-containing protein [Spatholobus suberectus]
MSYAQENDTLNALYEVSLRGSVSELDTIIQRDPLILHKLSLTTFTETPLHISALLGHLDFTKSLLTHKPQLTLELDHSKRTPLHLASAEGHIEIVHVLLQTCGDACLMSDQDGRIPLHYAAMRGRTEVARKLIGAKPESIIVFDGSGKTLLHLCVEHNHLETLKTLMQVGDVSGDFLNFGDFHHGNTILHLAVILKQVETIGYLLSISKIREEANIENKMGCTALDMLKHDPKDWKTIQIKLMLVYAGIKKNQIQSPPTTIDQNKKGWSQFSKRSKMFLQYQGNRLEEMRGMLSMVVIMISTMTFNAVMNPPGGVIQGNEPSDIRSCYNSTSGTELCSGKPVLFTIESFYFSCFVICNTFSFVASLSVTLLLVSGIPLKNEVTMGILSIGMGITLTFLMFSYFYGAFMLGFFLNGGYIILSWLGLVGLIIVFTIIRVIYWVRKVRQHRADVYN